MLPFCHLLHQRNLSKETARILLVREEDFVLVEEADFFIQILTLGIGQSNQ
jgi:hypothetical protein